MRFEMIFCYVILLISIKGGGIFMNPTLKKTLKIICLTLLSLVGLILLILVGYVIYLSATYYRIDDNQTLDVTNNQTAQISLNEDYSITTYNIGFGAYTQDFDFFMDTGEMLDGTKTSGSGSRAKDKQTVLDNTNGALQTILQQETDFAFFQEVDTKADRSFFVNQYEMLQDAFTNYSSVFASNFHSGFLFYPLTNPHGAVNAGIATFSKYEISESVRRSFPIDNGFFTKFFDLDRCFQVNRLNIQGSDKQLVLINLHMSAYDEGGKIRALQLEMLKNVLSEEYAKGNYVIAGGDWNHDIANSLNTFETQQKVPEWVAQINEEDLPEGFSFATSTNAPTCRSTDMPYEIGVNYSVVIDGFIVSDNVTASVVNIDTDFMYSDHNPVKMTFSLS